MAKLSCRGRQYVKDQFDNSKLHLSACCNKREEPKQNNMTLTARQEPTADAVAVSALLTEHWGYGGFPHKESLSYHNKA